MYLTYGVNEIDVFVNIKIYFLKIIKKLIISIIQIFNMQLVFKKVGKKIKMNMLIK